MGFGKKKERPDKDEFGYKDIPYTTSEKAMEFRGIKPLRGASQKSVEIRRKTIVAATLATLTFFTLSSITALVSNGRTAQLETQVEQNVSPAFKSRYDSLGESIITSYFGQKTPPVNVMSNVQWPTSDANTESSASSGGSSNSVEVQSLSLVNAYQTNFDKGDISKEDSPIFKNPKNEVLRYSGVIDGRQYEFGVYLIIPDIDNPRQLPYLVSPPTILPMDRLVTANVEGSKPSGEQFTEQELNEGTINNINRWASAYAQDDRDTLKTLTGDGRVEAVYPGVGGFVLEGNPEVLWSYQFKDNQTDEDRIVARIQFSMSTPVSGNSSSSNDITGSSGGKFAPVQVMDVLLGNFSEGEADIIAWGPGGMWQTLEPRMNAVIPVVVGKDEEQSQINPTSTSGSPTTRPSGSQTTGVPGAPTLSDSSGSPSSSSSSESSSENSGSLQSRSTSSSKRTNSSDSQSTRKQESSRQQKSEQDN